MINYLSPSSLKLAKTDLEEFYRRYLCPTKIPREPQIPAMAAGSALDAFVKNYLVTNLRGSCPDEFILENIFEAQVEAQCRDIAWKDGQDLFNAYKDLGALNDLMIELQGSQIEPQFEFTVRGNVREVPVLGKPDVFYVNKEGQPIIVDFKVNGRHSAWGASPKPGYVKLRPSGKAHKNAVLQMYNGLLINIGCNFEDIDEDWCTQNTIYSWLMGQEIGGSFIIGIEQFACKGSESTRIASFRGRPSKVFQEEIAGHLTRIWDLVNSNWIFRDMSYEDSLAKQAMIDKTQGVKDDFNDNF